MATPLIDDAKTGRTSGDEETRTINDQESKYLTFRLAGEEYGIEILKVREIIGAMKITAMPRMPAFMKGVINLRDKVIPVVSLRGKFGFAEVEFTEQTCIIVVDVAREIGIIVDAVSEVLDIPSAHIQPPPRMGGTRDSSFILGMGQVGESVMILLDIDRVLTDDEIADVTSASAGAEPEHPSQADDATRAAAEAAPV